MKGRGVARGTRRAEGQRVWPPVRLPVVALALAGGIAGSAWCGPLATAPLVWAFAAAVAALAARRAAVAWLAVAALAGAGLAARERARAPALPAGVIADDRIDDTVTGVVIGPVLGERGGVGLVIELEGGDARVLVTVPATVALPGDRVMATGRLRTPRGFRNPGGIDRRQVVRDRGADLELSTRAVLVVEEAARWTPWRAAARAHRVAVAAIAARGGDPDGAAIVRAAVVGDRAALGDDSAAAWRGAGVYHALSVSGLHLAVVAMLLFGAIRRAWSAAPALALRLDAGRVAAAAAAPAAIAYTLLTGGQTATLRALAVVLAILAGVALRRRLAVIDAVGLAAIAILGVRPSALLDPSFQLSFVAAATLCLLPRRPAAEAGRIRRWVVGGLRTSIWVTATTAPITAWHFHQIALGGVIGNLVLAPLVELVVIPAGLAGLLAGPVGGPLIDLAIAVAAGVDLGARGLAAIVPVIDVPPPRPLELAGAYALLGGIASRRRTVAVAGVAAIAVSIGWSCAEPGWRDEVRVTFLDVGQGDAAVVELPGGAVWLIDAGGLPVRGEPRRQRAPGEAIRRFLAARRIRRIDVAVVTHPHPDHYLGLLALAGEVPIGELWTALPAGEPTRSDAELPGFEEVEAALAGAGTREVHPPLGAAREDGGATLEVLGPIYDPGDGALPVAAADPVRSVNDDSLVVAIVYQGRRVLLLGDLEREGEERLVAAGVVAADVVKVAHHGSATSSAPELVAATGAGWAVISCGVANRFGFPDAGVVDRWRSAGATVLRTDQRGAITVTIDGDGEIEIESFD